jgi:mono/diheme cytochrome c family protein
MRAFGFLFLAIVFIGCSKTPVSFKGQVQPILTQRCAECHGANNPPGKIVLTSYDSVMNARTIHGRKPLVIAGNPSESWLYMLARTDQPHFRMPPDTLGKKPLPEEEVQLIGKWIMQGARNN